MRSKLKRIWVHKASSFRSAERFDRRYYLRMSFKERLETVDFLRQTAHRMGKGGNGGKRLRRVIRIIRRPAPANGFTFVEILVTLSILAVLFVPTMQLFSHAMDATNTSRDLITAVSLAKWEMERAKNIGASAERLKAEGAEVIFPLMGEPPLALNGQSWRVRRSLKMESEPLEITVEVNREGQTKPLARLVTLVTDFVWQTQAASEK